MPILKIHKTNGRPRLIPVERIEAELISPAEVDLMALRRAAHTLGFMVARNPKLLENLGWQRATEGLTALLNGGGK
jgi:hypothetical protein